VDNTCLYKVLERGYLNMAKEVCVDCGKENKNKTNPWYECSGCGAYHCLDCLQEHMDMSENSTQKKDLEK